MRARPMMWIIPVVVLLTAAAAPAQTVRIEGGPFTPNINSAVSQAVSGATILISTGTFFEAIVVTNKNLTFKGGYNVNLIDRPGGYTAVDAGSTSLVFWIVSSSCRVDQVNMVHGSGVFGGACLLSATAWMEFVDSAMCSNAAWWGGGLFVDNTSYGKLTGASRVFTNSAVWNGGGIRVDGRCDIVHEDADVFDNNVVDGDGGGIWVESAGFLRLYQGDVSHNSANAGGGDLDPSGGGVGTFGAFVEMGDGVVISSNLASWGGGMAFLNSTVSMGRARNADVRCTGNSAWRGGGLFASNSEIYVQGALVDHNGSGGLGTGAGGGAHVIFGKLVCDTNAFEFDNNTMDGNGGGLSLENSTATLARIVFGYYPPAGNESQANGGGLYATNSLITIHDARFAGNQATNSAVPGLGNGGAMALYNSRLVMTNADVFYTATNAWGNTIAYNAAGAEGGAIDANNSDVHLRHMAVLLNTSHAGPIHFSGPNMLALNDTVVADNDSYGGWGAITLLNSATGWLFNCTIYSNGESFFNNCYGLYGDGSASIGMSHSILWGHALDSISNGAAGASVQTSLIQGGWLGPSANLDEDPQLYPTIYHLMHSSPCIDYGLAWGGADVDMDGEPRSGNYDLGADEWQDSDGDKLPDAVEDNRGLWLGETTTGTDPGNPDTDGDRIGDGDEWIADTDPNDTNSCFAINDIWFEGGVVRVNWSCGTSAHQVLEYNTNPTGSLWQVRQAYAPPTPTSITENFSPTNRPVQIRVRGHR